MNSSKKSSKQDRFRKVLLSIKPQFVEKIISGEKRYEYRKKLFKDASITHVVIYASTPVQRIVGQFSIEDFLTTSPEALWAQTSTHSGISKEYFDAYFINHEIAHAIKIDRFESIDPPINPYEIDANFRPPQSFCYLDASRFSIQ